MKSNIQGLLQTVNFATNAKANLGPVIEILMRVEFNLEQAQRVIYDILYGRFNELYGEKVDDKEFSGADKFKEMFPWKRSYISNYNDLGETLGYAAGALAAMGRDNENSFKIFFDFLDHKFQPVYPGEEMGLSEELRNEIREVLERDYERLKKREEQSH